MKTLLPRAAAIVTTAALSLIAAAAVAATPGNDVMPPGTLPRIEQTFAAWDGNHDRVLSLEEFRAGVRGSRVAMIEQRLHAQFNAVDNNRDGGIDADEYGSLLLVKRAGSVAPPLSTFDANNDKTLNFAEYADLVRALAERPAQRPAAGQGQ